jgi:hypothetical protein
MYDHIFLYGIYDYRKFMFVLLGKMELDYKNVGGKSKYQKVAASISKYQHSSSRAFS